MQLLFLYNFFTEQLNKCIETSKNSKFTVYDRKFNFVQVYSTFYFNYWLLFEEGLILVCLSLRLLKQINRKIPTELAIARKKSF